MAEQKDINDTYSDDRDTKMYGLQNTDRIRFNTSMVWVPIVVGISVATGVLTTRGLQRLFSGTSKAIKTNTTSAAHASSHKIPETIGSRMTARTFTGFIPYGGDFKEPMDAAEAALVLGCRETSPKDFINTRFKTLMKANHPDQGGSPFMAAKINDAKTVLMKANHY
eukprot:175100_1